MPVWGSLASGTGSGFGGHGEFDRQGRGSGCVKRFLAGSGVGAAFGECGADSFGRFETGKAGFDERVGAGFREAKVQAADFDVQLCGGQHRDQAGVRVKKRSCQSA